MTQHENEEQDEESPDEFSDSILSSVKSRWKQDLPGSAVGFSVMLRGALCPVSPHTVKAIMKMPSKDPTLLWVLRILQYEFSVHAL